MRFPNPSVPVALPPPEPAFAEAGLSYAGKVPYVFGGANPQRGWDCSGMWNWILAQKFHMVLPGGVKNFTGNWHGPVVLSYVTWRQAITVHSPEVGDLCLWAGVGASGHMGCCTQAGVNGRMISALDPAEGTKETPIQGFGPAGAPLIFRRITGVKAPGLTGCAPQAIGSAALIGGIAWTLLRKQQ